MAENIEFNALTFNKPGRYHYTIKELSASGYGWIADKRTYRVTIVVVDNQQGELVCSAEYPDGKPLFINVFSCIPAQIALCAEKNILGVCTEHQHKYNCCFLFGLYNEQNEAVATAQNFDGMIVFPRLVFTEFGVYRYTIKELTQPFCSCWVMDKAVFPVEIKVRPRACGTMEAKVYYPNGEPIFNNRFSPCCGCLSQRHVPMIDARLEQYERNFNERSRRVFNKIKEVPINRYQPPSRGHAQVGFCDFGYYDKLGNKRKGCVLVLNFPYSNTEWIQVFPDENQGCVLESLGRIFAHIGGVPHKLRFDSASISIASESFWRFARHYGFEPELWERRRRTEIMLGRDYRNMLMPASYIEDWKVFNQALLKRCGAIHRRHDRKISLLWEAEKAKLLTLPE